MQVYINSTLREDVIPLVGGSLEQNAEHKTTSKISVKFPSDSEDIRECDYIKLENDGAIVHAGTILGISQQEMGQSDLGFKIYDLTITSNADYISSVLVDLVFPEGASIANVLLGNHSTGAYSAHYNELLNEFNGIFEKRILPEGIKLGTVDDFSNFILSEQATLWGSYVADVLDTLCSTAGAWWDITCDANDMYFNMRFDINRDDAPFKLDGLANIYELQSTRNAFTLYSAVRVVGGKGKGSKIFNSYIDNSCEDTAYLEKLSNEVKEGVYLAGRLSDTKVILTHPIHSGLDSFIFNGETVTPGGIAAIYRISDGSLPDTFFPVGVKGIHDDDDNYPFLASYGGNEIESKGSIPFYLIDEVYDPEWIWYWTTKYYVFYYPQVPITARLVDPDLVAEIKAQRGGSGIIEYVINDNSITDFETAASVGQSFLKNAAKRAYSVVFKTRTSGLAIGQIFKNADIPLYGVSGDYKITALSSEFISEDIIEYTVTASTAAYNDSLKSLFYSATKVSFKLGSEIPPFDGLYLKNDISIRSTLEFVKWQSPTCSELESLNRTCNDWESFNYTWQNILNAVEVSTLMGNYLTQEAKNNLIAILNGGTSSINLDLNNILRLKNSSNAYVDGSTIVGYDTGFRTSDPVVVNNTISTTYYIGEYTSTAITKLVFGNSQSENQIVDVNIDKTANNERGLYALTITKLDEVI